jgi:undecaprenyl pyrophosphate synthase
VNGLKPPSPLHIFVYCHEDGKLGIIQTARDISQENLQIKSSISQDMTESERSSAESQIQITEARLNSVLTNPTANCTSQLGVPAEPDLLLVMGNIKSTLGFLPWHIRLTEIL